MILLTRVDLLANDRIVSTQRLYMLAIIPVYFRAHYLSPSWLHDWPLRIDTPYVRFNTMLWWLWTGKPSMFVTYGRSHHGKQTLMSYKHILVIDEQTLIIMKVSYFPKGTYHHLILCSCPNKGSCLLKTVGINYQHNFGQWMCYQEFCNVGIGQLRVAPH